jgi:hypothetical protein
LYQQAEQACAQKQYLHAAHLLERLCATPGLSAAEVTFCQLQRNLCLRDAGLLKAAPSASTTATVPPANADCGPRALALVCQRVGVSVSVERLRLKRV